MPDIRRADVKLEKGDHGAEAVTVSSSIMDRIFGLFAYARNVSGAKRVYSIFAARPIQGDADEAYSIYAEGDCKIEGTLDVVGEITKDGQSLAPVIQLKSVTLTPAQIKILKGSPFELIAAPGAGKMVLPYFVWAKFNPGAIPYINVNSNDLQFGPASDPSAGLVSNLASNTLLDEVESKVAFSILLDQSSGLGSPSGYDNQPLVIKNFDPGNAGEFADGDGTLTIKVHYSIIDLD